MAAMVPLFTPVLSEKIDDDVTKILGHSGREGVVAREKPWQTSETTECRCCAVALGPRDVLSVILCGVSGDRERGPNPLLDLRKSRLWKSRLFYWPASLVKENPW